MIHRLFVLPCCFDCASSADTNSFNRFMQGQKRSRDEGKYLSRDVCHYQWLNVATCSSVIYDSARQSCVKLLSTWCHRPRFLLILIFASYAQQKLRGVKAGEQISFEWCPFYAEKTDWIKINSSRTSLRPLHTRNTGRQRGIFHWTNAERTSAYVVTAPGGKAKCWARYPGQ